MRICTTTIKSILGRLRPATVRPIVGLSAALVVFASGLFAAGLPLLTSTPWDLTYGSNDTFTGYSPAGAVVNSSIPGVLLYGTAAGGGAQQVIELIPFTSADVCYSTSCPSTSAQFPTPNFEFSIGSLVFDPYNIVAGTGIGSATTDFSFYGDLTNGGNSATFPSADGKPTLYTGQDPGGTTSYLYFVNADGTVSNELHVTDGLAGSASLTGILVDPPSSVIFDIVGFTAPGPNSFLTAAPTPEPATLWMFGGAMILLGMAKRSRKVLN